MQQQTYAELTILDRILDLLEEGSVDYVARKDTSFAQFVGQIYETVQHKSAQLSQSAPSSAI